ncbi:MAG: 4Fe-4S dicluster domain-containing protein [Spirochaetes bacterium]|nr:4Fe-4S dicluster domain-containing protein [Spirochaetota bacterium]
MADKAFLVDTTKCTGCKACQTACKQWNNLPSDEISSFPHEYTSPEKLSAITFNHVIITGIESADSSIPILQMMHKKCFHCEIANCITVCPAEAIYKNNYWVIIDQEKCIGCDECVRACVYNVPHLANKDYNEYGTGGFIDKDKAYKCHACTVKAREIPACVSACPSDALTFDFRLKIVAIAKKRLKIIKKNFPDACIYGLEEFGGMHVITILKDIPEKFGLPTNPRPIKPTEKRDGKEYYGFLSGLSFGMPSVKRALYKLSKYLAS